MVQRAAGGGGRWAIARAEAAGLAAWRGGGLGAGSGAERAASCGGQARATQRAPSTASPLGLSLRPAVGTLRGTTPSSSPLPAGRGAGGREQKQRLEVIWQPSAAARASSQPDAVRTFLRRRSWRLTGPAAPPDAARCLKRSPRRLLASVRLEGIEVFESYCRSHMRSSRHGTARYLGFFNSLPAGALLPALPAAPGVERISVEATSTRTAGCGPAAARVNGV